MSKPTLSEYLEAVKEPHEKGMLSPGLLAFRRWYEKDGPILEFEFEDGVASLRGVAASAYGEGRRNARTDVAVLVGLVEEMRRGLEYETHPGNNEEGPIQQAANAAQFLNELEALVPGEAP